MRVGVNPEKESKELILKNYHRVILPVYIPNFEGYFKDSLKIFKLCIESLLLTVHPKTRITIYNNNSHESVKEYIDKKYEESVFIDQVFHSKENLGKINAILASVKGNLEPIVTITDSDVLFKDNWQKAAEEVMLNFPEAGMVSPVPSSRAMIGYTANNWYYGLIKGKLRFKKVLDPDAMHKFDVSLGNKKLIYSKQHLSSYLVLKNKKNDAEAVMGCGHFVATLHREVFDKGTNEPAFIKIVGGVENKFIDIPNENLGFLRLATKANYAFHMGNFTEDWMYTEFKQLKGNTYLGTDSIKFKPQKLSNKATFVGKVIIRLLKKEKIKALAFKKFGLNEFKDYSF
jgi:hypothetical protein